MSWVLMIRLFHFFKLLFHKQIRMKQKGSTEFSMKEERLP